MGKLQKLEVPKSLLHVLKQELAKTKDQLSRAKSPEVQKRLKKRIREIEAVFDASVIKKNPTTHEIEVQKLYREMKDAYVAGDEAKAKKLAEKLSKEELTQTQIGDVSHVLNLPPLKKKTTDVELLASLIDPEVDVEYHNQKLGQVRGEDITDAVIRHHKDKPWVNALKDLYVRGLARIVYIPDDDYDLPNLKGDLFNPKHHPDIPNLSEQEQAYEDRIDEEGVWGAVAGVYDPVTKEYEQVDSVWGFIGDEFIGSGYDEDFVDAILKEAAKRGYIQKKNPLKRGCSRRTISKNIAREIKRGKKPKQAAAIAFSEARRYKKKHRKAKCAKLRKNPFMIFDWAGNLVFKKKFNSFEDAEDYLSQRLKTSYDADRQEYEILNVKQTREARYLDPKDPRSGRRMK